MTDLLINISAIVAGLFFLVWSSGKFIAGATGVAQHLQVSPLIIGLLILGFGTSAPEIMVSIFAAIAGSPELALGNALGSNIANVALVLGVTAVIASIKVQKLVLCREFPILLLVMLIAGWLMTDGFLSLLDGIILLLILVLVLGLFISHKNSINTIESQPQSSLSTAVTLTIVGLVLLVLSSKLLVWGAVNIATDLGVSNLVIGLTIVAIGTSLPELAASITAALRNQHAMAIGNIIGSNLFNILAVIGISAIIQPYEISILALQRDFIIMAMLTIFLYLAIITSNKTLNRNHGIILTLCFVAYLVLLFQTG